MHPEDPSGGQTEPVNGPDSGVEDTLSGTVDIDGAMNTQKNLIVFPVRGGQNWIGENTEQKNDHQDPGATPKQPFFSS